MRARYTTFLLLGIIFFLGLFLRLYHLGDMPAGFHKDEVMSAYFGRFILENGRDVYGNVLPLLYVDKFGDFPPALPMYFSGAATYVFGFTVFAARFPVALIGALTIVLFYFLAKEFWQDKRIALFSALLIAIIPWHFVLSRATAEGIIALAVVVLGLLYLVKFLKDPKIPFFIIAAVCFCLTYFLYPGYRVLIPLVLLPLPFLFSFKKTAKTVVLFSLVFFILLTTLIASTNWGRGRFDQTSMFGTQSGSVVTQRISILAQEEGTNRVSVVKMYHNKYIVDAREFINQYLTYFSPQYLFMNGGLPYRYAVSDEGLLYVIMVPFLLLSLFYLSRMKRLGIYLLYLLLISPLPSPLTVDDVPNVHRTLFMVVPLVLLTSFGFVTFLDVLRNAAWKKVVFVIVLGILAVELTYFLHMYYNHANAVKSFERGDTNKEMIWSMIEQKSKHSIIYSPTFDVFPIYYLYFTKNVSRDLIGKIHTNLIIRNIDNINFMDFDCPASILKTELADKNILVINRADCPEDARFETLQIFTRHDGTTSYRFLLPKKSR